MYQITTTKKLEIMKAAFNLKNFLTENKAMVLTSYENLTKEKFFNGISLKDFMLQVMNVMQINNPKSEKRAATLLPSLVSMVIVNNSKIEVLNDLDAKLKAKYEGTAYMAMV